MVEFIKTINLNLNFISTNELIGIAGLLLAVLLPILILLIETVRDNVWDQAVILKKVINFRQLLCFVLAICIAIFCWNITNFQIFCLIVFSISSVIEIRILIHTVMWISDWNNSVPNGTRYNWRLEILSNNNLKPDQQLVLWNGYLESMLEKRRKINFNLSTANNLSIY